MNWMKHLPLYFIISAIIIIPGIYSLLRFGLKPSIEFTGGSRFTLVSLKSSPDTILQLFKESAPQMESSNSNELTIKSKEISQETIQKILDSQKKDDPEIKLTNFETIGPALGKETIKKTANALIIASFLLLTYISLAFKQLKYGICAVLAMFHDTAVLLGSFSLLGHFWGVEVDLLFVTAVLTILSFSVHDTIVVYDRIRELTRKNKNTDYVSLINQAVTETMARSLNNSLTIIFMLLAMFLMGGETTKYFSLALLIGTITGTYSSTFTAAPLLIVWEKYLGKNK
ncbi:MAG: SecF protein [Candidatus Collierbacteria bacterium GW2011_GWD2_45_10]|uniref:Protein-export membrane protein SecF n=1 Tax=Candidatus Collierbacteria bacterium GW2011_GWB2_44_22 TaxID=1618387 RepID=A0A0G1KWM6_9BACT|nr:MAG: SecF protein [Candidatus Collierbacteria bacterium GW2011_GWA2_44_13]KKT49154.1 MAG: SecF protein [Candidatus Collierbacteria bacterium GW2011_GWB1_44_197]KKT52319.1 MAG: SecF protein [Candidatus Collierbacteria bacterium GW2011_GWB2_44_22]KKT63239.1 MAG: SecF protein [Candidatus Collierbacteria bacterium GW2011_GWD1_44_27]KKT64517.1 MAG: SecF protein [Candidatus Collierbacteria bacterium GW2011_GWC2_44_30]KKT89022.1 MAG: SecF protein [Candidatus Collierbacteria bacterium GW2011_GWD2_4